MPEQFDHDPPLLNRLTRRAFVGAASCAALLGNARPDRIVKVREGLLSGIPTGKPDVSSWLGIPYAEPPLGPLRWRPPQPPKAWQGVRHAAQFSASPCQMPPNTGSVYYEPRGPVSEDCLTLNVWAPDRTAEPRPVMVWIYGGAFVSGSSNIPLYDGANLASQGVVFVSINYRVGILGSFAHPALSAESANGCSGNYGLMDQIAALRWVRENIAAFGGDPGNVTIFGQSAGAFSVGYHLVMPQSRGLFHRAIAESGAPMGKPTSYILLGEKHDMEQSGLGFQRKVGAKDIAAMRQMDPMRLVEANNNIWEFYPMIDGDLVPAHPFELISQGRHARVPLIVGRNRDEGAVFSPFGDGSVEELYKKLDSLYAPYGAEARRLFPASNRSEALLQGHIAFGDFVFCWNSAALAAVMARDKSAPVYSYRFDFTGTVPAEARFTEGTGRELGAFHGAEIGFALGTQGRRGPLSADQRSLMQQMSGQWLQFARTGNPNGSGLPHWPQYRPGEPTILHIDAQASVPGPLDDRERLALLGRAMGNRILDSA
jgi:para-nitrobenzyl esterase